jgi:hypothetical protein
MTTYLSQAARDQIEAARRIIEVHAIAASTGRCVRCDVEGPCSPCWQALKTLGQYGVLPRRAPGSTLQEGEAAPVLWWGPGPAHDRRDGRG